jgi:hypothetical protein
MVFTLWVTSLKILVVIREYIHYSLFHLCENHPQQHCLGKGKAPDPVPGKIRSSRVCNPKQIQRLLTTSLQSQPLAVARLLKVRQRKPTPP